MTLLSLAAVRVQQKKLSSLNDCHRYLVSIVVINTTVCCWCLEYCDFMLCFWYLRETWGNFFKFDMNVTLNSKGYFWIFSTSPVIFLLSETIFCSFTAARSLVLFAVQLQMLLLAQVNGPSNSHSTTKFWLNTPQCTQSKSNVTTFYSGEFECSLNNFRSQTTAEFL